MRSNYAVHLELVQDSKDKQKQLKEKNMQTINDEVQRKQDANEIFWRGVMRFITHMTLASVVIYTLFHFA